MSNKPTPTDIKLYKKIKAKVYKDIPKHSAYRSGIVVQKYKKAFKKKYKGKKKPYKGKKTKKRGLKRWFNEKWVNQRGEVGYKHKNDIYRPSIRINKKTPTTHKELTKKQIKKARKVKYRKGRVKKFADLGGGSKTRKKIQKPKKTQKHKKKNKNIKKRKNTIKKYKKIMKKNNKYYFKDYPEFTPNLSPREIFLLGSFGGTYWRPISSAVTNKKYKNVHHQYPASWWKGIPEENLSSTKCDVKKNKYGVRVGTSLDFWEGKGWIKPSHPYGWVHWYCDFFSGKRSPDDERQIKRWLGLASTRGRFMRFLVTQILKKNGTWNDETISPKIRQVLQHWGYVLTKKDFDAEIKRRGL